MKKWIYRIMDGISVLIIAYAVFVLLTVLLTGSGEAPSILGYSVFRVMTGSMEPVIPTDALILVHEVDPSELEVGDIISFYSRDPSLDGAVNTHRIVAIDQSGEEYSFTTRGDANNIDDLYLTREEDLVGEVIFSSVAWGKAVRLLSNPLIFVPCVILPLAVMLILNLRRTILLAQKIAKEEEEAAVREALEALKKKREEEIKDS
jgi:signal peptidase I